MRNRHSLSRSALFVLLSATSVGHAFADSDNLVRFISCPVYRDTDAGRKSGCWLADEPVSGARYDITPSPTKPDWNFAVLVEGRPAADPQPSLCGGVTLDPVRVSVLPDRCPRHMLPAEGYLGRAFKLPKTNLTPLSVERPPAEGPFEDRSFYLFFDLNSSFVIYQFNDFFLDEAAYWLNAAKPDRVIVTGYAVTERETVSGRVIQEHRSIAKERADKIALALARLGIDPDAIEIHTILNPPPFENPERVSTASRRRVEIRAEFDD